MFEKKKKAIYLNKQAYIPFFSVNAQLSSNAIAICNFLASSTKYTLGYLYR